MLRFAPRVTALLLCGAALAGCASTSDVSKLTGGDTAKGHAQKEEAQASDKLAAPTDLESGVRQAQLLRYAGKYDEAVNILSQLMLVASDDARVVSEYGKTLAQMGRAQEAQEFLSRAIELSVNDWTLYSALGVSYDQLGNQVSARTAYEHALALRPEEPSVLNNYALSRMLAGDTDGARILIARAQGAGGASDPKIAANVAMLNKLAPVAVAAAPQPAQPALASNMPPPRPMAPVQQPVVNAMPPRPAPRTPVMQGPLPGAMAQAAPRPLGPMAPANARVANVQPANMPRPMQQPTYAPMIAPSGNSGVVMQPVPFDPYAGPVKSHAMAKVEAPKIDIIKTGASKTSDKAADKMGIAKSPDAKPAPIKAADAKTPDAKTAAAAPAARDKNGAAKPAAAKASIKDAVPALRLTADARNP